MECDYDTLLPTTSFIYTTKMELTSTVIVAGRLLDELHSWKDATVSRAQPNSSQSNQEQNHLRGQPLMARRAIGQLLPVRPTDETLGPGMTIHT